MEFMGRSEEISQLCNWNKSGRPAFLSVIYGRRRIGKTRLVEETFKKSRLLTFEGLEGQSTKEQQMQFLARLASISGRKEYQLIKSASWTEILILLSDYIGKRPTIIFLDEFQWLAASRSKLVSSFKYVWDNYFCKNNNVHVILCGSVCSFLLKKVIRSKALYGRIDLEINLKPLQLPEIKNLFRPKRSLRDVVEMYMSLGGVPQYLKMVDPSLSVRANLENLCFSPNGYLVNEFERLFASHFGTNRHYRKILLILAKHSFATREELQKGCNLDSGGRITRYLEDLETAGFIERYVPVDKPSASKINRFRIVDPYLIFYFRFIQSALKKINQPGRSPNFSSFVPDKRYYVWCGQAFESLCLAHSHLISEKLGFSAVNYNYGSWFSRQPDYKGFQIDLMFLRDDRVITICEMKFQDAKIGKNIIPEIARKRSLLPNPKNFTIETVLITASPATKELINERYFNRILTLSQLFG